MKRLFYWLLLSLTVSGCSLLNQSIMFKTDAKYEFAETPDFKLVPEYKISPNDIIMFDIYSNNGFSLINITSYNIGNTTSELTDKPKPEYLVDADGYVKLPLAGRKKISGLTIREVENELEKYYSEFYNKPFVVAKVINRKVIYFSGNDSDSKIIPLTDNTTLLQLIAKEGGISVNGKAQKVKLIRYINETHEVYHIDLSTIEGVGDAHIVLQANDIVYIEPRRKISSKAIAEIAPTLSLLSSTLLIILTIDRLSK